MVKLIAAVAGGTAILAMGTGTSTLPAHAASLLPAGQLAYTGDANGDLDVFLISTADRRPQNLTNDPANDAGPTWAPDGRRLAFASTRAGTWDIFVLNVADGTVRRLTKSTGAEFDPAWSPNGKTIAYENSSHGQREIFRIPAAGGTP